MYEHFGDQEFSQHAKMLQTFKATQNFKQIISKNLRNTRIDEFKWDPIQI